MYSIKATVWAHLVIFHRCSDSHSMRTAISIIILRWFCTFVAKLFRLGYRPDQADHAGSSPTDPKPDEVESIDRQGVPDDRGYPSVGELQPTWTRERLAELRSCKRLTQMSPSYVNGWRLELSRLVTVLCRAAPRSRRMFLCGSHWLSTTASCTGSLKGPQEAFCSTSCCTQIDACRAFGANTRGDSVSTLPAWIVCAHTRTASEGWWASEWCGLSAGDQRRIAQRCWAQIGDDDTGEPGFQAGWRGVPVVQATQYQRCNQRLINWRRDWTPNAAKLAQRSETPG